MKSLLKVSIIITNYNNERYIANCIESAIKQTYKNLEVLVVDDCSTDNSINVINHIARKDSRIRVILNSKNLGYLRSFNIALNELRGDLVAFIDGDDWISPNKLERQVKEFEADSLLGCCGTGFARTDETGHTYEVTSYPSNNKSIRESLLQSHEVCFCGSSVMVRRDVIDVVGGYREFFIGSPAEDYDWLRRIANRYKVANLSEPMYMYRFTPTSLSANVKEHAIPYFASYIAWFLDFQRQKHGGIDGIDSQELKESFSDFLSDLSELFHKNKWRVIEKRIVGLALRKAWTGLIPALRFLWRVSPIKAIKAVFTYLVVRILPITLLLKAKSHLKINGGNDPEVMKLILKHLT